MGGRSARVVQSVLDATLEVLCEQGYGGLSVEEVARRAGVNKTTVYRRWPTRFDLVQTALRVGKTDLGDVDTGDVEKDLVVHLTARFGRLTPGRNALIRLFLAGNMEPELTQIIDEARRLGIEEVKRLLERGIERGQLPRSTPTLLVVEVLLGAFVYKRLKAETISRARIAQTVALVLSGVRA